MADATFELISSTTVPSDNGTLDLQNIPQTFTDLRLIICSRSTYASQSFGGYGSFNNDNTTGNYPYTRFFSDGSAQSQRDQSLNGFAVGELASGNSTTNIFGMTIMDILDYTNTTTYKTWIARTSTIVSTAMVFHYAGHWKSTAAINRIKFDQAANSLKAGTTANLYGIKAG